MSKESKVLAHTQSGSSGVAEPQEADRVGHEAVDAALVAYMLAGAELGYRLCEKGMNIQAAMIEARRILSGAAP